MSAVSGAIRAADMSVAAIGAVDYAQALDGLSLKQAQLMLTTQGIVGEEQRQMLIRQGLIATSDNISAKLTYQALQTTALTKAEQQEMLIEMGLMDEKSKQLLLTNSCTEAELRAQLTKRGYIGTQQDEIVTAILGTGVREKEAISWKVLTTSILESAKAMLVWLATNPVGQMIIAAGVIAGVSGAYDLLTMSVEEAQGSLEEFNQACSDLDSATTELQSIDENIKSIQDKGTLSLTDQADLSRLEQEKSLLEKEIQLLERKKELTSEKSNSDAVKAVNDGTYKNGDGFFSRSVDDLTRAIMQGESDSSSSQEYLRERGKKTINDAKIELAEIQRRNMELLGQITGTDEDSQNAKKQLQEYIDYVNKYLYTAEELQKMKFDGFLSENESIKNAFNDLSKNGADVTSDSIEKLANKFPALKTYMDENGISAETLAAEFTKTSSETETAGGNLDKMTVSIGDLEKASDGIKTLGSAFKEMSDDGHITTKTLGEIKTAAGLADDEWAGYETTLLNAKKGSSEFNQAMSELTYKVLEHEMGAEKLANATEEQIAAVLRENGVLNANAVAESIVIAEKNKKLSQSTELAQAYLYEKIGVEELTKKTEEEIATLLTEANIESTVEQRTYLLAQAKEALRIKTALAKASTAEEVIALATEASQAGITGNALNDLIMDMGIFNNTNLDVSQKVAALQEMGYYAHWTAQGLANIDKVKKYSFDGKDYIVSYDNGKLVGIEQEREIDIPKVEVPKITVPNYSGAASGGKSGSDDKPKYSDPKYSDPTDAIIKRINAEANQLAKQGEIIESNLDLIDSEKDYAKAIDETNNLISNRTSQIDALKLANSKLHNEADKARNSNSYSNEESWFDADGDETEAFHELKNSLKSDDAQEKLQNEFNKIQKFKKAYLENEKLIQDLTKENIKSIEDISDIASKALENHFDERNEISERWIQTQTDFDQLAIDGQIEAYARMVRNNREFLKEIEKNEHLSAEERDRLWKETSDKIVDYQLEAYNLVKEAIQQYGEEVEKGYDIRISRLNSESSLLSTHFDLINAISEEQHNLNKELAEAEVAGAKMNKIERQTLFTKEEHAKLTDKLNGLLGDAVAIQSDYLSELETATKETIEEITNNYERQYELKMKEYEVVKAELALVKAEQKLKNVENEKSVRTWDGTKWVYEADFQDVVDAKLAVEDAKYAVWQAQTSQAQQTALNAIDSTADSLETQKNLFAETLEELSGETKITGQQLTEALKYIAEVDLPTFEKIIEQFGDSLSEAFDVDVDSVRGSAGGSSSSGMPLNSSHLNYSRTVVQMKANSAAYASATPSEQAALHSQNASLAAGIGATFNGGTGHWEINGSKLYANGSKSTQKGLGIFDENGIGSEYVLTKDGILHNFNMGDKVFNPKMGDNLYEAAQIDWKKVSLADFGGLASIDNSIRNMSSDTYYNVNGVNINSEEGGEIKGFVKFLKAKKI